MHWLRGNASRWLRSQPRKVANVQPTLFPQIVGESWRCGKCNHLWHKVVKSCFVCGTPGKELATVPTPDEIRVIGPLPSSIGYLHSLVANGQGDKYEWTKGEVTIKICGADRTREPSLDSVEKITLEYDNANTKHGVRGF